MLFHLSRIDGQNVVEKETAASLTVVVFRTICRAATLNGALRMAAVASILP